MFYSRTVNKIIKLCDKKVVIDSLFIPLLEFWWGKGGSNIKEWQPKAGYLNSYYVKSSNIVNKVSLGEIIPKGNIETIHTHSVTFIDGTEEKGDTIIFATGYAGMNCMYEIPESIKNGEYYRHLFLVNDPSVARVGFIRPYLTSIPMMIEMQSRYVAKVFSGKIQLPTQINMKLDYDRMKQKQSEEFSYDYERVQGIVDPYDYMDLIGYAIGAIPSIFSNLNLWKIIYFGSWSPYYYRLNDPDKSKREIAKQEIIKLNNHPTSNLIQDKMLYISLNMIIMIIIFCIIIYLFKKYRIFKSMYKTIKNIYYLVFGLVSRTHV